MSEKNKELGTFSILDWSAFLLIFAVISMVAQTFNFYAPIGISTAKTANVWAMGKGFAILYFFTVIGLILAKYVRIGWPAVLWVSVVLIIFSMPWLPTHEFIVNNTKPVALLPMATPVLAYAGFAIAKRELQLFKKAGWKIVIVTFLTFTGSYIGSAFIAHIVLKAMGQI